MRFRSVLVSVMVIPMAMIGNGAAAQEPPQPTSARLRAGGQAPLASPLVVGGGEVALDLTVGTRGRVTKVDVLRATPPYTDLVVGAVKGWQFDVAQAAVKGVLVDAESHVLVVAVYRAPQVYAAPGPGVEPATVGQPSWRCRPPTRPAPSATVRC
jgi:hypothetical protein